MEKYQGCCYIESCPIHSFADEESANLYAKEKNESKEAQEFINKYAWDDIEYKFFVIEVKHNQ
jgi:hypothetical protein